MSALNHESAYLIEILARAAATLKDTAPGIKILQHIEQILDKGEQSTADCIHALQVSSEQHQENRELAERRLKEIGEILDRDDLREVALERIRTITDLANTPVNA